MATIKLWGFNGSTYVRTVRTVLAEKGVADYEHIPLNVLKGEPKTEEHRARHPFGKVPVIEVDGFRVIETGAIVRYLDAVLPGTSLTPSDPGDRARGDMIVSLIDAYGYGALIGGVVAYHLFPDFVGGKNAAAHRQGLDGGRLTLDTIARIRNGAPFLAGDALSIADLYVAPIAAYVAKTPHREELLGRPGIADWWERIAALPSFQATAT